MVVGIVQMRKGEPMSDLIDRQAAIDCLRFTWPEDAIRNLPSAGQERKKGRWIIYVISPFDGEDVKCSECGQCGCAPYWDFCPNCGADMRGEQE